MKSLTKLFKLHEEGKLNDQSKDELNHLIITTYFKSQKKLNKQEFEYAEDLIFEQFENKTLDPEFAVKFAMQLKENPAVNRKYRLLSNLAISLRSGEKGSLTQFPDDQENEKEEAELREILDGVIEEIKPEKELSPGIKDIRSYFTKLMGSLKEILFEDMLLQPQFKLAVIAVTLIGLAFIIWFAVKPAQEYQMVDRITPKSSNNNQVEQHGTETLKNTVDSTKSEVIVVDQLALDGTKPISPDIMEKADQKGKTQSGSNPIASISAEAMEELLEYYEPSEFYNVMVRGETTTATDLLLDAVEKFNEESYDTCILQMTNLLNNDLFRNVDTINMINYYIGNCYLAKGLKSNESNYAELSLKSFIKISRNDQYFLPAQWCSVFAYLKTGNFDESIKILENLANSNYLMGGKIPELRDSIIKLVEQEP